MFKLVSLEIKCSHITKSPHIPPFCHTTPNLPELLQSNLSWLHEKLIMLALRSGRSCLFYFFVPPIVRRSNASLPVCKTTSHYLHACGEATEKYWAVGFLTAHRGAVIATTLTSFRTSDLLAFCLPRHGGRSEGKRLSHR